MKQKKINSKPELLSFSDFLMLAPFYDIQQCFKPEIEYIKGGVEALMQSRLVDEEEELEYIEKNAKSDSEEDLQKAKK